MAATIWHLILNAVETSVGTWTMIGPLEQPYALVKTLRRGTELGYRVTTIEEAGDMPRVLGYYRTLVASTKAAHQWFTSTRGPSGRPHAGWSPSSSRSGEQ